MPDPSPKTVIAPWCWCPLVHSAIAGLAVDGCSYRGRVSAVIRWSTSFCLFHSTENGFIILARVMCSARSPSRIASMMSGAGKVRRENTADMGSVDLLGTG